MQITYNCYLNLHHILWILVFSQLILQQPGTSIHDCVCPTSILKAKQHTDNIQSKS